MRRFSIFKIGRVKVEGPSMEPTFYSGDWLIVRWFQSLHAPLSQPQVRTRDIVVIERKAQPGIFYVKRITSIQNGEIEKNQYWVESDNPSGVGSPTWGWLDNEEIIGKVLVRYKSATKRRKH